VLQCAVSIPPFTPSPATGNAFIDTLVCLSAISRWIRDEEATLLAGCRLLNDALKAGT
jgi:hypothetical protein